jgi:hypothetical protein
MPQKSHNLPKNPIRHITNKNRRKKAYLEKPHAKNAAKSSGQTGKTTYALTAKVNIRHTRRLRLSSTNQTSILLI